MKPLPEYLYKYRSFDLPGDVVKPTERIFKEQTLWFPKASDFNDPFDGECALIVTGNRNKKYWIDVASEVIKKERPYYNKKKIRKIAEQVYPEMMKKPEAYAQSSLGKLKEATNDQAGVLCLTAKTDDVTMWSHYANSHRGICLRFNTKIDSYFRYAREVKYSEDYPTMDLCDVVIGDYVVKHISNWMLTKSPLWKYEEEWRIIIREIGDRAVKFPAEALDGVVMGCRISDANKAQVLDWVSKYPTKITVMQAVQSKTQFKLKVEEYVP